MSYQATAGIADRITPVAPADERFTVPLYSVTEAALHLDVPVSTFRAWTHGYARRSSGRRTATGEPIVTTVPRDAGVSVPFVGLAEAHALAAIRRSGVPLQRIRPALQRLQDELGIEHVLASQSLYTDGAEVLYDFAESRGDTGQGTGEVGGVPSRVLVWRRLMADE